MIELLPLLFPINNSLIYSQNPAPIIENYQVQPLPGELNRIPVFNSNSPELVLSEGILLSTFSADNKANPEAHLDYSFEGRFDLFAHHVAKARDDNDLQTLYIGILINNPTDETVTIDLLQGASYLSQPDAPFVKMPPQVESKDVYAGPGSRVMGEILQNKLQDGFPRQITLKAGESKMLMNAPIPVQELVPKINGRSTYLRLNSDGKVNIASLAMYGDGEKTPPSLQQWQNLLTSGELSAPRDLAPTPPNEGGRIIYGRVAGVSIGSVWESKLLDDRTSKFLTIPTSGDTFAYGLSTLRGGTFGTGQIQTAPMAVRYPDTAYSAHGNYGVEYSVQIPLSNPTNETKTVDIAISSPVKTDLNQVRFETSTAVVFRGLVQVKYYDEQGKYKVKYVHLVQNRGDKAQPILSIDIPPQQNKNVSVNFLYPPDATPPQILTITTR